MEKQQNAGASEKRYFHHRLKMAKNAARSYGKMLVQQDTGIPGMTGAPNPALVNQFVGEVMNSASAPPARQARHRSNAGQMISIVGGNDGDAIGIGGGLAVGPNGHTYSDEGDSANPYTRN